MVQSEPRRWSGASPPEIATKSEVGRRLQRDGCDRHRPQMAAPRTQFGVRGLCKAVRFKVWLVSVDVWSARPDGLESRKASCCLLGKPFTECQRHKHDSVRSGRHAHYGRNGGDTRALRSRRTGQRAGGRKMEECIEIGKDRERETRRTWREERGRGMETKIVRSGKVFEIFSATETKSLAERPPLDEARGS